MNQGKILENFIFNENVQAVFENINSRFIDLNILEVTGMGFQEIKHSNILGWILGDNEHGLEYIILNKFLKKISELNSNISLKHYIFLPRIKKQLMVYREKNNIDLLLVDESNKIVIAIENKILAMERVDGEDGGQLSKYESFIKKTYPDFDQYYVYLTVNCEEPSNPKWMRANFQMVADSLREIIEIKKNEISLKTKIIFESYIDLLKRRGIVADKDITELCKKIWDTKEYREALEILYANRPTKKELIEQVLKQYNLSYITKSTADSTSYFIEFQKDKILLRLVYSTNKGLSYVLCSENENINLSANITIGDTKLSVATNKSKQYNYFNLTKSSGYIYSEEEISESIISKILEDYIACIEL